MIETSLICDGHGVFLRTVATLNKQEVKDRINNAY